MHCGLCKVSWPCLAIQEETKLRAAEEGKKQKGDIGEYPHTGE